MEAENLIFDLLKESKGFGILGLGAWIFWKMRKSIGASVTDYVDSFKKELIQADKESMNILKDELDIKVSKSLKEQLDIVKNLIDSNQEMNEKILKAIDSSISALNMHTEELVIVIKRQGWAEESIKKITEALKKANISIENIKEFTEDN